MKRLLAFIFSLLVLLIGIGMAPAYAHGEETYVVKPGDTLWSIAQRNATTVAAIRSANGLAGNSIYSGQRLTIPGGTTSDAVSTNGGGGGEKWIDVDLTTQTLTAYEGKTVVLRTAVSTGRADHPTVVGTFRTYIKYPKQRMVGGHGEDRYDLPNVPDVMYFYRDYALHGTYWHTNFGTPMSAGCVNVPLEEAAWLYDWAPLGTKVVTHY